MTNNIRVFLWLGLALALYVNYTQWQIDYGAKPVTPTATGSTGASEAPSEGDTVPQAAQPAANASASTSAPTAGEGIPAAPVTAVPSADSAPVESAQPAAGKVRVVTDVLTLDIDLKGGTLVYAELPAYPIVKGQPAPVVLFNQNDAATNYVLATGLAGSTADAAPSHLALLSSAGSRYELASGQNELRVPLTWSDGKGVTVTKTFVFRRSFYVVGLEYAVDNQSAAPWVLRSYARIKRTDPAIERSMFKVESFAFRGPVIWAKKQGDDKFTYHKLDIEKPEFIKEFPPVTGGWLAGMQHHFTSAIVPDASKPYEYSLSTKGREYILGAVGPAETVAPGTRVVVKENLFVGPKLQAQLVTLNPELDRVADYTWLTLIAKPLFWLLDKAHSVVGNWGLAIIFVTFILKLLFYPLSEKAGRSIARMRAIAPRMKALQETYKDDRSKLGQATMDLYRQEKVNPLAGCLPMLIQMPVFLAFYWVLLESVELRQAPFFGWLNDLSSRDPYFILPALNGVAMWFQQKLNPPPPDPMQAKIFQFMPVVFSVMFALFPAGLVLYWVTNTGLSILQQWNINRKLANEDKARRK
jgi:YidC/Oxa1 family membrane protein insertase